MCRRGNSRGQYIQLVPGYDVEPLNRAPPLRMHQARVMRIAVAIFIYQVAQQFIFAGPCLFDREYDEELGFDVAEDWVEDWTLACSDIGITILFLLCNWGLAYLPVYLSVRAVRRGDPPALCGTSLLTWYMYCSMFTVVVNIFDLMNREDNAFNVALIVISMVLNTTAIYWIRCYKFCQASVIIEQARNGQLPLSLNGIQAAQAHNMEQGIPQAQVVAQPVPAPMNAKPDPDGFDDIPLDDVPPEYGNHNGDVYAHHDVYMDTPDVKQAPAYEHTQPQPPPLS